MICCNLKCFIYHSKVNIITEVNIHNWLHIDLICIESNNIFSKQVSSLEELGIETMVLSMDCQKGELKVHEVSSNGAAEFLTSTEVVNNFALHFKG